MSFEAINSVVQAEAEAKAAVAAAEAKARQMILDAQAAGKAAVEAAGDKADSALAELRRKADAEAMDKASELQRDVENKKAALRARAEARLEQAASLVVERIVKS
jgi:V/A-type H+-transporting ATPase subunit G/H